MAKEVENEIELHFCDEDELPKWERIDPDIRIVRTSHKGELLIEEKNGWIKIGVAGGSVKLRKTDFNYAYFDYITRKTKINKRGK